jgi:hypothetical protein
MDGEGRIYRSGVMSCVNFPHAQLLPSFRQRENQAERKSERSSGSYWFEPKICVQPGARGLRIFRPAPNTWLADLRREVKTLEIPHHVRSVQSETSNAESRFDHVPFGLAVVEFGGVISNVE